MKTFGIILLWCCYCLFVAKEVIGLDYSICVSQVNGSDSPLCGRRARNSLCSDPCRSVEYAIKRIWNDDKIISAKLIIESLYYIEKTINLTFTSHPSLKVFDIQGLHGNETELSFRNISSNRGIFINLSGSVAKSYSYVVNIKHLKISNSSFSRGALTIKDMPRVTISDCYFEHNQNTSVFIEHSNVLITNCSFLGNIEDRDTYPMPNMTKDLFMYRGISLKFDNRFPCQISVQFCLFEGLGVSTYYFNNNSLIEKDNSLHDVLGGAIFIFFNTTTDGNSVIISNCMFRMNAAISGGSVGIVINNTIAASHSSIIIKNSDFYRSYSYTHGGALSIEARPDSFQSGMLQISNVTVKQCVAVTSAGGLQFIIATPYNRSSRLVYTAFAIFESMMFVNNSAQQGAAVYITCVSWNKYCGVVTPVLIRNIIVRDHVLKNNISSLALSGPFVLEMTNAVFEGDNVFSNNTIGTGLILDEAFMFLNGTMYFYGNKATLNGGGMSFIGVSFMMLKKGAILRFKRNYATVIGGAIYVRPTDGLVATFDGNPLCFLQYVDLATPIEEWNVSIEFIENGAGFYGGAIFADTFQHCSSTNIAPFYNFSYLQTWEKSFKFVGNYIGSRVNYPEKTNVKNKTSEKMSSSAWKFTDNDSRVIYAYPGETIYIDLTSTDQFGTTILSTPTIHMEVEHENITVILPSNYITIGGGVPGHGKSHLSYLLSKADDYEVLLNSQKPIKASIYLSDDKNVLQVLPTAIHLRSCIPGYRFEKKERKCVCDTSISGVLRCQDDIIYLQEGYWANITDDQL